MSKVNEVWHGVKTELCPSAQFLYWYELLEELEYFDLRAGRVRIAKLVTQDDGKMKVEVVR